MIKPILQCFVIVSVLLIIGCSKDLTSQERIAKARAYIEVDDYASANIELKNAALKEPGSAEVRYELAGVALALGDGFSAEKEIRRAVELGMPPEKVTLSLISALYLQDDPERVLTESENFPVQLEDPVMADILAYRAYAQIQQEQYKFADATITKALEYNPDSVLAILAKASYEAQVGRRETAMTLAKRAAELDLTSPDAWALIGDLHAANGELAEARQAYDMSVENRHYASLTMARRALVLAQLENYPAAKRDINALLGSGYKDQPYVNFVRGYIAFRQQQYPQATLALEKSVEADPGSPLNKLYLAASYMEEGKLEQARRIANQLIYEIPNSVEVARMFASLNMKQQDFGAARERLTVVLEAQPDDAVTLGMLASMALMEGNGDEAVDYLQRLAVVSPEDESVQRMLNLAMTMRGDFLSQMGEALEQQVSPEDYDQALVSAGAALKQGQLREAVTIAENLRQQFPDRAGPLNMLAAIYLSVGDWRRGKELLEQTLTIDPLDPSAVKTLAKIYMRTDEQTRALELLSAYLKKFPEDKEAVGIQAELIVATASYQDAEKRLIESLDKDPDNLELQARLTNLYFDNGKYEQVSVRTESMSDETIKTQPLLMELRGKALFNMGNTGEAEKVWKQWADLSPNSVLANFYYADSLAKANQLPQALKHLEKCQQLKPLYMPARIALIRVSAQAGEMDKAFAEMKKLQSEMREDRADVWYTQGWLNAKAGNHKEAEQALQKSLALEPTPDAVMLLFTALNSQDRSDEALVSLEAWLEKFPENAGLMAILGQTYLGRDESDKATSLYERMLAQHPESVLALNNLAWLNREKAPKQALDFIKRASALAPEDPYVLSTYATVLAENGQAAEGEKMLRQAVALHPDNMQAKLDLGRLLIELGKAGIAKPYLDEVVANSGNDSLQAQAKDLLQGATQGG